MKRRKLKVGRLILVVIIALAVLALLIFGFKLLFGNSDNEIQNEDNQDSIVVDDVQKDEEKEEVVEDSLKIQLVDYECYPNDKFDFDFIVARIRFKDEKAINYSLSEIVTGEGIKLSEVNKYIEELASKNYFVSKKSVVDSISSTETTYIATLFIPYKTTDSNVVISFKNENKIEFNVKENIKDIQELLYEDGTIISNDDYDIYVSDANMAYVLFKNNNMVDIPSSRKIYAFTLKVNDIKEGLTLKEAKYVSDEKKYDALTKEYTCEVVNKSMFDGTLEKGDSYGLLFEVMSQDTDLKTYSGELWLKFSSSDEWVKISAEFN